MAAKKSGAKKTTAKKTTQKQFEKQLQRKLQSARLVSLLCPTYTNTPLWRGFVLQ